MGKIFDCGTFSGELRDGNFSFFILFVCLFFPTFLILVCRCQKCIDCIFQNKLFPSHMCIHPVFSHRSPAMVLRRVTKYHSFCYTAACLCSPLQGQVFRSMTSQIPGMPTPSPCHLANTLWVAVQVFLSCRKDQGCHLEDSWGKELSWDMVSLTELFHFVWQCSFATLWLPMALFGHSLMAESASTAHMDICFLTQTTVHVPSMCFHVVVL